MHKLGYTDVQRTLEGLTCELHKVVLWGPRLEKQYFVRGRGPLSRSLRAK